MNKPVYFRMIFQCMSFGIIILNESISIVQNYAIWIQIALSFMLKLKNVLQTMLEKSLIHQIVKPIDHCLEREKKGD